MMRGKSQNETRTRTRVESHADEARPPCAVPQYRVQAAARHVKGNREHARHGGENRRAELVRALRDAVRRRARAQKVAVLRGGERSVGRQPRRRGRDRTENVGRRLHRAGHRVAREARGAGDEAGRDCDRRRQNARARLRDAERDWVRNQVVHAARELSVQKHVQDMEEKSRDSSNVSEW